VTGAPNETRHSAPPGKKQRNSPPPLHPSKPLKNTHAVPAEYYAFGEFPWPDDLPHEEFPSGASVHSYCHTYAGRFGLLPLVRFGCRLVRLRAQRPGGWRVVYEAEAPEGVPMRGFGEAEAGTRAASGDAQEQLQQQEQQQQQQQPPLFPSSSPSASPSPLPGDPPGPASQGHPPRPRPRRLWRVDADYAVVATGIYAVPQAPAYRDAARFQGLVMHARDFRDASAVRGRHVLVVGAGKSALDVGGEVAASRGAASITWLMRQAHWPMPRTLRLLPAPLAAAGCGGQLPAPHLMFSGASPALLLPPYYTASWPRRLAAGLAAPLQRLAWRALERAVVRQFGLRGPLLPRVPLREDLFFGGQILDATWTRLVQYGAAGGGARSSRNDGAEGVGVGGEGVAPEAAATGACLRGRQQQQVEQQQQQQQQLPTVAEFGGGTGGGRGGDGGGGARGGGGGGRGAGTRLDDDDDHDDDEAAAAAAMAAGGAASSLPPAGPPSPPAPAWPAVATAAADPTRPDCDASAAARPQPRCCHVRPLLGEIARFAPRGVVLRSGEEVYCDAVLFCTGYSKTYGYLDAPTVARLGPQKDGLWLYRHVLAPLVPGLAFVGAEASTFNNVLTSGLQAEWLAAALCGALVARRAPLGVGQMQEDVRRQQAWRRRVMPAQQHRGACVQLYAQSYHAQLLRDMGLGPPERRPRPMWGGGGGGGGKQARRGRTGSRSGGVERPAAVVADGVGGARGEDARAAASAAVGAGGMRSCFRPLTAEDYAHAFAPPPPPPAPGRPADGGDGNDGDDDDDDGDDAGGKAVAAAAVASSNGGGGPAGAAANRRTQQQQPSAARRARREAAAAAAAAERWRPPPPHLMLQPPGSFAVRERVAAQQRAALLAALVGAPPPDGREWTVAVPADASDADGAGGGAHQPPHRCGGGGGGLFWGNGGSIASAAGGNGGSSLLPSAASLQPGASFLAPGAAARSPFSFPSPSAAHSVGSFSEQGSGGGGGGGFPPSSGPSSTQAPRPPPGPTPSPAPLAPAPQAPLRVLGSGGGGSGESGGGAMALPLDSTAGADGNGNGNGNGPPDAAAALAPGGGKRLTAAAAAAEAERAAQVARRATAAAEAAARTAAAAAAAEHAATGATTTTTTSPTGGGRALPPLPAGPAALPTPAPAQGDARVAAALASLRAWQATSPAAAAADRLVASHAARMAGGGAP